MAEVRRRRPRDPVATREAILEAARTVLAKDGPEAISLSAVALLAGVNRGTAYQHFSTRENLIEATLASVSDQLLHAAYGGDPEAVAARDVGEIDVNRLTRTLADFAVDNPELARIWFLQLLSSPEPAHDPFWRQYLDSMQRFASTDLAQPGIDCEVMSVIMVAGMFLWPVWAKSHEKDPAERRRLSRRFADEALRLSLFGSMNADHYPELVRRLAAAPRGEAGPHAVAAGR